MSGQIPTGINRGRIIISKKEIEEFKHLVKTTEDDGVNTLPKSMNKTLCKIGLIRHCGGGYYEITDFGNAVLDVLIPDKRYINLIVTVE